MSSIPFNPEPLENVYPIGPSVVTEVPLLLDKSLNAYFWNECLLPKILLKTGVFEVLFKALYERSMEHAPYLTTYEKLCKDQTSMVLMFNLTGADHNVSVTDQSKLSNQHFAVTESFIWLHQVPLEANESMPEFWTRTLAGCHRVVVLVTARLCAMMPLVVIVIGCVPWCHLDY